LAAFFQGLRDRKEISRDTLLAQVDLSEADEARKREREAENFDDIFDTISALNDPVEIAKVQAELNKKATEHQAEIDMKKADQAQKLQVKTAKSVPPPADNQTGGGGANQPQPKQDPKAIGRARGGRNNGGGAAPGTGQGQAPDPRKKPKGS